MTNQVVIIRTDAESEMRQILVDGVQIEYGNFWDFDIERAVAAVSEKLGATVITEDFEVGE